MQTSSVMSSSTLYGQARESIDNHTKPAMGSVQTGGRGAATRSPAITARRGVLVVVLVAEGLVSLLKLCDLGPEHL